MMEWINGGKDQISHAEEFQIIYVDVLKKEEYITPHSLSLSCA